jgi:hypothetical protein
MRNKQIAEQIANIAPGLRTVADHSHAEQAKIGDCVRAVLPYIAARPLADPYASIRAVFPAVAWPVADHSHAEQAKIGDCIRAVFPCVVARPVAEPPSPELLHAALRQLEINSRVYPT